MPFLPPGDLPDSGIEPASPELAGGFFTTGPPGKPLFIWGVVPNVALPVIMVMTLLGSPSHTPPWRHPGFADGKTKIQEPSVPL